MCNNTVWSICPRVISHPVSTVPLVAIFQTLQLLSPRVTLMTHVFVTKNELQHVLQVYKLLCQPSLKLLLTWTPWKHSNNLNIVKMLVCVMNMHCVFCEVETEFLMLRTWLSRCKMLRPNSCVSLTLITVFANKIVRVTLSFTPYHDVISYIKYHKSGAAACPLSH